MPETESDHHRGVAAVARLDLVAPPAAPATARDEDEEEDGFTFAAVAVDVAVAVPRLQDADCAFPDARIGGPVYPVFGRLRWSLPNQQQQQEEEEDDDDDPAGTGTGTVRRVPLGRLLLEDRLCDCAPSASGQQPADDDAEAELDGVPAETYCLWSPGASPPAGSRRASPARCWKSGSTGSSVLRWRRQRVVSRSDSDGKEKFVFLDTSSDRIRAGEGHGRWMNRGSAVRGSGKSATMMFLPCKQRLVGLVASAVTFRRSYLPF